MPLLQYADVWKILDTPHFRRIITYIAQISEPLVYTKFTLSIWSGHMFNSMSEK